MYPEMKKENGKKTIVVFF